VSDGAEALTFLKQEPPHEDAPRLDIVVLDIPNRPGIGVLESIKTDADLKIVVVMLLTSSDSRDDTGAAARNHATTYPVNPVNVDECESLAEQLEGFCLHTAKLP
jgi:Response regulator receiver domain.